MPVNTWLNLLLFMALLLALSLYGLAASGQFPNEHRSQSLRSAFGGSVLFGSIIVSAICLVAGLIFVWRTVPWYAAVIGGGLVILAAPILLRPFSDAFVNGPSALLVFSGIAVATALAMLHFS